MNLPKSAGPTARQTEVFLAVAEHRSVRAAAESLGIPVSNAYKAVDRFLARCRNIGR